MTDLAHIEPAAFVLEVVASCPFGCMTVERGKVEALLDDSCLASTGWYCCISVVPAVGLLVDIELGARQ